MRPNVCKCFGVETDNEIASPIASWKAENDENYSFMSRASKIC